MDRRGFISSLGKGLTRRKNTPSHIYLPYIKDISLIKKCKECDKPCVDVCEMGIIKVKNSIPVLDMSKNGCTFCKKCAYACGDIGVLDSSLESKICAVTSIKTKSCLSWNSTMCFSCKDICTLDAINFFGTFRPTINKDSCNSCGACISLCPANAIEMETVFSNY